MTDEVKFIVLLSSIGSILSLALIKAWNEIKNNFRYKIIGILMMIEILVVYTWAGYLVYSIVSTK